jgi:hypothetical protein
MRRLLLCSACFLFLLPGCGKKKPPAPVPVAAPAPAPLPPPPAENMLPVEPDARLYYDDVPSFPDSIRHVIRDRESWGNIWAQATTGQASAPPLPIVDFSRSVVLLVGAGRRRTGDQIHVDSVGTKNGRLVAVVRTTVDCHSIPSEAHPFEIVRVKRSDRPVVWVERHDKAPDCE